MRFASCVVLLKSECYLKNNVRASCEKKEG